MAKILIVDDDQAILDIIELWLEDEDHTVVQAPDGTLALKIMANETFEILITDLIMPKTEGIQLIMEIRQAKLDIGIIAISSGGKKGGDYLSAAEKLGADVILSKPLEQNKLISAVDALLQ